MAVVSAIALLAALGLAALLILRPWEPNAVAPHLSVAPGAGADIGLGESEVVARGPQPAVAPAQPAAGSEPRFAAAGAVADESESQPRVGVSVARVVASRRPGGPSQESPQPSQPEPIAAPQPSPAPVAIPVATSSPPVEPAAAPPTRGAGGGTPGPVAGGGGGEGEGEEGGTGEILQVCEGDDYTLTLSPLEAFEGGEVPPPVTSRDLTVYFGSFGEEAGFYLVLLDGQAVEVGDDPVLLEPGKSCAQIDLVSLLGEPVEAGTVVHIEAVTLGEESEAAVP